MYESVKIVCNDLVLRDQFAAIISNENFKYQKWINILLENEQKITLNIKEERLCDFLVKPSPSKLDIILIDSTFFAKEKLSSDIKILLDQQPFKFIIAINTSNYDNKIDQYFLGQIPVI